MSQYNVGDLRTLKGDFHLVRESKQNELFLSAILLKAKSIVALSHTFKVQILPLPQISL